MGTFPIGIQPERFTDTLAETKVQQRIAELENEFKGRKLMVGVDRLDYVKGLPQKLRALEVLLADHPELVGSVVLVQIAIPTRGEVEEYQNLRVLVNELVGRINGKFGESPMHYPFLRNSACPNVFLFKEQSSIHLFISCISPWILRSCWLSTRRRMLASLHQPAMG